VSHIFPVGTAAFVSGVPYTLILHGMDFDLAKRSFVRRFLAKRILRNAKTVIANSVALANEIADFAHVKKPMVVYPCVRQEMIDASADLPARAQKDEHEDFILLTVARLVPRKGHTRIFELMRNLPRLRYQVVGDGPYILELEKEAERLSVRERVQFFHHVSDFDLPTFYREADLFVMPTISTPYDREGFGIVYLEAALFGLPVVASDLPGVREAVLDHMTGCLVNSNEELRDAIVYLWSHPEIRIKYGADARLRVLGEFSREHAFQSLLNL
jgi:phosphatidylinositol alpha-1,6-mannosyltransferase